MLSAQSVLAGERKARIVGGSRVELALQGRSDLRDSGHDVGGVIGWTVLHVSFGDHQHPAGDEPQVS